jgi:predicted acyl esterase
MEPREGISHRAGRFGAGLAFAAFVAFATASPAAAGIPEQAQLVARGSIEQVQVTGATPGARVKLLRRGDKVDADRAGELGGVVFRHVEPGRGYRVTEPGAGATTPKLRVLTGRPKPPTKAIYDQDLPAGGYGYLTTRDGTELAINVHLPGPASEGPYPTLVEYSGYGYANPSGPESGIQPVADLLGYAVVDVNMRGTGCSGGAFDYFERLQSLDGYDVIETVARQPWAMHDKVGMLGISYGGISQLFVAATRPPSLAAITPLSVIDNTQTTLYPGGILNTGFALEWAQDRVEDSQPAGPDSGQRWAWRRIEDGDATCKANQDLHPEAVDLLAKTRNNRYYRPRVADPLSPVKFVNRIEVPVYLACQWQDEQTGGHCPALARRFKRTKRKWFTFTNGTHSDSLDPETFNRWFDFLELYVARRRPQLSPAQRGAAPVLYSALMGVPGVTLPDDPIQQQPDFESALAAFEDLPRARVLLENGAGGNRPGAPGPAFEASFKRFPPPGVKARSWFLGGGGKLKGQPTKRGADRFTWDPDARPPTNFSGNTSSGPGGLWTASPDYDWTQSPAGRALSYATAPLRSDTAVLGAGSVQLWVRSSARNVDLQATVSEIRPDGKEAFVQGGWLRTDARKLDRGRSTLLEPQPSYREDDARTLPRGRWVKVAIPLYYQGHVYREGSRIRVTVSAPGGDQPIWAFAETEPKGTPTVDVAHSGKGRSRVVLPVVAGLKAPVGRPPCPGLRGQPCRDYVPLENRELGAGR